MLYKLFKNGNVKVILDMSYNLEDILESIGYCIDGFDINYIITKYDGHIEKEYAHITSVEDYVKLRYIDIKKRKLEK